MTERGSVTLPKELRARAPKSDLFEVVLRDDGVYELRPRLLIDPSQAWFWTEDWQAGERRVDDEYATGRYETFDDAESFIADLEAAARGQ
jgi:hypothetical protein